MQVGLGITTHNRPEYLEKCIKSIAHYLPSDIEMVYVINDGSDTKHRGAYKRAYKPLSSLPSEVIDLEINVGVARAKNELLRSLLEDTQADWIILCEDDIVATSSLAIRNYVEACEVSGMHHLSFAHHGSANVGGPIRKDDCISYYRHSIGAWTIFSRESLLKAGIFDENFNCAWEHVEHEMRLMTQGFMPGAKAFEFPDLNQSYDYLSEIPGSISRSSIRQKQNWQENIRNGLIYWRDHKPETYDLLFGPEQPLYQYAKSTIGDT